jgi:hypothetical protein
MTLDRDDLDLVHRLVTEVVRNSVRGTGGLVAPQVIARPGTTVQPNAVPGDPALVQVDGDDEAVPVVNATGQGLGAGDRVLVTWHPPHGVYATSILRKQGWVDHPLVPGTPPSPLSGARLFARDNGSGKAQLCVLFPTGAVQVIATEP